MAATFSFRPSASMNSSNSSTATRASCEQAATQQPQPMQSSAFTQIVSPEASLSNFVMISTRRGSPKRIRQKHPKRKCGLDLGPTRLCEIGA